MSPDGPFRCTHCGNRTRFDVDETIRRRRYLRLTLSGDAETEGEEIVARHVVRVVCRYCERSDGVESPRGERAAGA